VQQQLLNVIAVLGVVLGCSLALAADGPADTGDDVETADAPPPPPAGGTADDADVAPEPPTDEIGVIKRAYLAIKHGEHVAREIAALVLILVGLLFRRVEESDKYSEYLPAFFRGKRGHFILITLLAAAGALGHQALAGSFGDWDVWKPAVLILMEASFGYVGVKSLLAKEEPAAEPSPV
jgi:hypothetical protein